MNDKTNFNAIILAFFLAFPFICFAQKENKPESLTLSIKLKDRVNPNFSLCTAINPDEPLEFSWNRSGIINSVRATLFAPKKRLYRLKLEFKQGTQEIAKYQFTTEYSLKLNKPKEETDIASSLSDFVYDRFVILSKKACK